MRKVAWLLSATIGRRIATMSPLAGLGKMSRRFGETCVSALASGTSMQRAVPFVSVAGTKHVNTADVGRTSVPSPIWTDHSGAGWLIGDGRTLAKLAPRRIERGCCWRNDRNVESAASFRTMTLLFMNVAGSACSPRS